MTPAIYIALGLVVVGIAVAVGFAWARAPRWLTLPSGRRYLAPASVTPEALERALYLADRALVKETTFSADSIQAVTSRVAVLVVASNSWTDWLGRSIGGSADVATGAVTVGLDLSALCHELAHLVEARIYGATDDGHVQWVARGISRADERYRTELAAASVA